MRIKATKVVFIFFLIASSAAFAAEEVSSIKHWERPVKVLPSGDLEPFYPKNCAVCHTMKYNDWKGSLHARSTGPGVLSQLDPGKDPSFAESCYFCHAPAVRQSELSATLDGYIRNEAFDSKLKEAGISCAVCHVRDSTVYGPKPVGSLAPGAPHKSEEALIFKSSEFCAACHQMDRGYELNGKLLTNTYSEWKESPYGRNNITCQNCHMPGASHGFRGIHDPEIVKKGLRFTLKRSVNDRVANVELNVENVEIGHYFPTYITPLLVVRAFFEDSQGSEIDGTAKESYIGRRVSLDLTREFFDTRIAPFDSFTFKYEADVPEEAAALVIEARVLPDEFYTRFFRSKLAQEPRNEGYKDALAKTFESPYTLYRKSVKIKTR